MIRFVLLAVPLLVLLMGLFGFAIDQLGLQPVGGPVFQVGGAHRVQALTYLGTTLLESLALTGLFLALQRSRNPWWFDGLLAGWIAWVFRGPVFVLSALLYAGLRGASWTPLLAGWLLLYSVCGLVLGGLARWRSVGRATGTGRAVA